MVTRIYENYYQKLGC